MRNSGCEVPDYMLTMKKASRDARKQLAAKAPKRDGISRVSKYEKEQSKRREEMISASKKRKLEGRVKKVKKKRKETVPDEDDDEEILSDDLD